MHRQLPIIPQNFFCNEYKPIKYKPITYIFMKKLTSLLLVFFALISYAAGPVAFQSTFSIGEGYPGLTTTKALFTVDGHQVYISKGNLWFRASNGTPYSADCTSCLKHEVNGGGYAQGEWKFSDNQYDVIQASPTSSSTSTDWLDLFTWGASGYTIAPWSSNYSSYPNVSSMAGTNYDWGVYNAISNGGNQPNIWRNMTGAEYTTLYNQRQRSWIGEIEGYLVFPDNWETPQGIALDGSYTLQEWEIIEQGGAIFFPNTGYGMDGGGYYNVGGEGNYWTTNPKERCVFYANIPLHSMAYGGSIRLVIDKDDLSKLTPISIEHEYRSPLTYTDLGNGNLQLVATANGDDFVFDHWVDGETANSSRQVVKEPSIYTAVFYKKFTITFDMGEHVVSPQIAPNVNYVLSESPSVELEDGYTFIGWSSDGQSLISFPFYPEEDLTLHAICNKNVVNITSAKTIN